MLVGVVAVTVSAVGSLGAVPSGQVLVDATVVDGVETLPAASKASTASVCEVPHAKPPKVKLVAVGEPALTPSA